MLPQRDAPPWNETWRQPFKGLLLTMQTDRTRTGQLQRSWALPNAGRGPG